MDSLDDSYLLTGHEPKNYDLMETYVESLHRVPDPPTVLRATVSRGCG